MRIGYLIPTCDLSGGIAVICQHANRLEQRGHDVFLINEQRGTSIGWFPNQNVPIVKIDNFPEDLDVLIATGWSTSFHVVDLPAKKKFYFVQSDETRFHPQGSEWYHITALSYLLNFNYMTEAKWIQKWLMENFGHKAELVPNGLDPGLFHPAEPLVPKGEKPRILLEGAIALPYKGMAEAFEAVKGLDVEVWCISSYGQPKPGWKVDRFFEQVPITQMKHIYSSCDILLKLSPVEGCPGPPMEMMACGGICVVPCVKGYDEYIIPDYNALVVDPLDIQGARDAVLRILLDKDLREKLIRNGRDTADAWKWEPSIDRLERYLIEVFEEKRGNKTSGFRDSINQSIVFFYRSLHKPLPPVKPTPPADRVLRWLGRRKLIRALAHILYKIYKVVKPSNVISRKDEAHR